METKTIKVTYEISVETNKNVPTAMDLAFLLILERGFEVITYITKT